MKRGLRYRPDKWKEGKWRKEKWRQGKKILSFILIFYSVKLRTIALILFS